MPFPPDAIAWCVWLWIGVMLLISFGGGWWTLAGHYRSPGAGVRRWWRFQGAAMRWMIGYGGCLHVGVSSAGLVLSVLFQFRPGHPPLLIPWNDIEVEESTTLMTRACLRFSRAPGVPLYLRPGLAKAVSEVAGGVWSGVL